MKHNNVRLALTLMVAWIVGIAVFVTAFYHLFRRLTYPGY